MPADTAPFETEVERVNELLSLYRAARDERRSYHDAWLRNYKLVNNRYKSLPDSWMPAPKDSEIYPVISALVGWMTDQENRLEFSPVAEPNSPMYTELAQLATDLEAISYSNWVQENYDAQHKLLLWDAFMYGIGISKAVWDPTKCNGNGNAVPRRIDPWCYYPDPNATSMEDMEYSVEVHRLSLSEVCRRYPGKAMTLTASASMADDSDQRKTAASVNGPFRTNPGPINGLATRWSRNTNGPTNSNAMVTLYEFWIKENSPVTANDTPAEDDNDDDLEIIPQWRCIVMCNDTIVMDELGTDIYPFDSHPYDRFVFDDIGEFYGIALVDHLASPQLYINRLLTAYQQSTELTGNPVLVESSVSGTTRRVITNKPGQRIPVSGPGGMQNKPEWMVPPSMSGDVLNLIQFWISRIENTSGLSAIVKGATPTTRNAEGVISTIQEAAFVRIRSAMKNFEAFIGSEGKKLTDMVVNFYSEPRMMGILGPQGKKTAMFLKPFHFQLKSGSKGKRVPFQYVMSVVGGSTFPTSRQARIAEATTLFAMGAVDDQYVLEAHQVNNIPEVIRRKTEKQAMMANLGVPAVPGARQRAGRTS